MTAPLMPRATAVWLVENTTLTFRQIAEFCELHELEIQAIADGDVAFNILGVSPVENGQLTAEEISRCEADRRASLQANELERNVKAKNAKAKKMLSPSQRSDKPSAVLWILKNCPEIIDSQICKLVGTTKPTIEAIRTGTHKDMANIRAKNPVAVGLCTEKDLDNAISISKARAAKKEKTVKVKEKKVKEPKAKEEKAKAEKKSSSKKEKKAAPKKEKAVKEKRRLPKRPKPPRRPKRPDYQQKPLARGVFCREFMGKINNKASQMGGFVAFSEIKRTGSERLLVCMYDLAVNCIKQFRR